jgi:hypothetical protein
MPMMFSFAIVSSFAADTFFASTTYSGEVGCSSRFRTCAAGMPSGPASRCATTALSAVICGGSAVTV